MNFNKPFKIFKTFAFKELAKLSFIRQKALRFHYEFHMIKWLDNNKCTNKHPRNIEGQISQFESIYEIEKLDQAIYYLEFGVYRGKTIKWWVNKNKNNQSRFIGFDTFTGLPENWTLNKSKGYFFANGQLPDVSDHRVEFYKGMFQQTLPNFIKSFSFDKRTIIHLDADLYSSTLFVLNLTVPYLNPGDILIFDEFNEPMHEFRAFFDFCQLYKLNYKLISICENYLRIAIKILSPKILY